MNCSSHARKHEPSIRLIGLPPVVSGPHFVNSGTFSIVMRRTCLLSTNFQISFGCDRSWFDLGLPPFALEWCVQDGEA